jgi:hypothetical protein
VIAERTSYVPLGFSYFLALLTGLFQATFWGLTGIGEMHGIAGPAGIISFIAWLGSLIWTFVSSKKIGWLSLVGIIPAFTFAWIVALLMWSCASGHGCI